MAEQCADDDDAKVGINKLRKSVLEELKMHDSSGNVSINKSLFTFKFFFLPFWDVTALDCCT